MKERPILFSGPMVRAILEGKKTQTRRIVKPQPNVDKLRHRWGMTLEKGELSWGRAPWRKLDPHNHFVEGTSKCRYGRTGDRMWVRETWHCESAIGGFVRYKASGDDLHDLKRWKPSIHMPRWASRITLEITTIRVERLNEISEFDAASEGLDHALIESGTCGWNDLPTLDRTSPYKVKWAFKALWESINGPGSWKKNPWVWVIDFKRDAK